MKNFVVNYSGRTRNFARFGNAQRFVSKLRKHGYWSNIIITNPEGRELCRYIKANLLNY